MALRFVRLTRQAIRALPPGGKVREHGVCAERLPSGDVRYSINIMVDGERVHRVVGRESEGVTPTQAERAMESIRTKAREGRLDLPAGRKLHRSFKEAAEEYLERLEQTGGKNIKAKRQHLTQHLTPYFTTERLDRLTEFAIKRYRKQRADAGARDATINRELATLSHLLRSAISWKWIRADAMPQIERVREERKAITVLTDAQCATLLEAAMRDQDGRLWLFVAFGLNTAMRHREILSVRYDQIDFAHRRVFIPQAKAGEREQPITGALADALQRQQAMEDDSAGWVFPAVIPKQSIRGHRTNMARPFARAVVRAGLDPDKVTPHVMRHTAITRLVKAGVDLPTVQRISGHKTLAMVLRYTHVHGNHVDAAIEALDMHIPATITPELHTPAKPATARRGKIIAINAAKTAA